MSNLSEQILGCSLGYLLNFNVTKMKDGIKRVVYNHKDYGSYIRLATSPKFRVLSVLCG